VLEDLLDYFLLYNDVYVNGNVSILDLNCSIKYIPS